MAGGGVAGRMVASRVAKYLHFILLTFCGGGRAEKLAIRLAKRRAGGVILLVSRNVRVKLDKSFAFDPTPATADDQV